MLTEAAKAELEKQQYRIIGSHSAVKICGWTKNMIQNRGGCYKLKFYGIMSNQCLQMTTSLSCANRCTFCWRGYKAPVSTDWKWPVDDPQMILGKSIEEHHRLLVGFNGSATASRAAYLSSQEIKHVALSLTGEPIIYPQINELIDLFNQKGISTFLVTNAQYPEQIRDLKPVTQLYLSLDAPEKELLKEIDLPLFPDYWERLNQSLDYLAQKKQRTCIRLTLVNGVNDCLHQRYAGLILKGSPDFIEVKAYMFVGLSRQRLSRENMPLHEEIVAFTKELAKHLQDYEIVSEHVPSRVVLLAKKKYKQNGLWNTWIDFQKYNQLVNSGREFTSEKYCAVTLQVGLSGKGTIERMPSDAREKFLNEKAKEKSKKELGKNNFVSKDKRTFVDETTEELEFYGKYR